MSFRGRLLLFFAIIVVIPMIAVALVLFSITADSETGKADAQIAQGLRAAFAIYDADRSNARSGLDKVASDPAVADALRKAKPGPLERELASLRSAHPSVDSIAAYDSHRGRFADLSEAIGPATQVGMFQRESALQSSIADRRLLIGAILVGFLLLALLSSIVVVRALQTQIARFLEAARRLAHGDFSRPVPVEGSDEFAALGREFNDMSSQLASKIDEVSRRRHELEDTIRRVGEAFAAGLDREGVGNPAVRHAGPPRAA